MGGLSSESVLREHNTRDTAAVKSVVATHRALSDVSCLGDFKYLWKLDLRLNNLTSLESLSLCSNLKWLCVSHNNLTTLRGIKSLSKLTVLNAGNNKLASMEEVTSLTSLCALILNDNHISSIWNLHQLIHLNTLVLSKNPISQIANSLHNSNALSKLSLSHCQIHNISTSLKSCVGLKELRLSHNHIKSLPPELARNKNLLNLDLGYNAITTWSHIKVLDSLVYLRNLNLQGNPIAAEEKFVKKVGKILPKLRVFNARQINKYIKYDTEDGSGKGKKKSREDKQTTVISSEEKSLFPAEQISEEKLQKRKGQLEDVENKVQKKSKVKRRTEVDVIDDGQVSFTEMFEVNTNKVTTGSVDSDNKRKKAKSRRRSSNAGSAVQLYSSSEIGMGGPSTWEDDSS